MQIAALFVASEELDTRSGEAGLMQGLQAASGALSLAFVCRGVWRLRRSRAEAYRWFQRSLLVSIFLTQVFVFYDSQISGIGGLFLSILTYAAIGYALRRETAPSGANAASA